MYSFANSSNVETLFRWIRLGIKAKWEPILEASLKLVTDYGRMKYLKSVYSDLYEWKDKRQIAINTFLANKDNMMEISANSVEKILLKKDG